jgi:hypothetical protein
LREYIDLKHQVIACVKTTSGDKKQAEHILTINQSSIPEKQKDSLKELLKVQW